MFRLIRLFAIASIALFAAAQLVPHEPPGNPPIVLERTLEAQVEVPDPMKALLDRSCRDCHSYETKWPWYSSIAPMSWLISRDVRKARSIMNFSEWTEQAGKKLEMAAGLLAASCSDVTVGRMPKPDYAFLHTEARLSDQDRKDFCAWSATEGQRLILLKRKRRPPTGAVAAGDVVARR